MKLLKLDMTQVKIKEENLPDNFTWGGRGLVDYLLTENMNPNSHALSLDSVFVLACGLYGKAFETKHSRQTSGNVFGNRKELQFDYQKKPMKLSLSEKQVITSSTAICPDCDYVTKSTIVLKFIVSHLSPIRCGSRLD